MKKLLKSVWFNLLIILTLLFVVVVIIDVFDDRFFKVGVKAAATRFLDVAVRITDVDLSATHGKLGIADLLINNPPGYQYHTLLELTGTKTQS